MIRFRQTDPSLINTSCGLVLVGVLVELAAAAGLEPAPENSEVEIYHRKKEVILPEK